MKLGEGINKLQEKYKDYIIFAKNGIFYNAIGKDALFLEQEFKLKKTCFGKNICKCGIPLNSIENFINKLEDEDIKYIVFDYIQGKNLKLEEQFIERYREDIGKNVNKEELKSKCKNCKNKRKEIIQFNMKQEEYIMWLYEKLKSKKYKHGGYTRFYVTEPKVRKIEKSRYIDRIVHRWLVDNFLEPLYVPQFINTSYACIKERGMHRAALYVKDTMRKCKINWKEYYILKMDVAKYFDNINKNILLEILKRKIKDKDIMWLINEILFAQKREKGLEIGNYTSQMFANIYLNEIDQFVKHKLHIKYYCRYLDDSIVIVKTKKEAKYVLKEIQKYLKENLQLELNRKTQIFKNKQGVNFCGYKINEYRMKLRDKGKRKLKKKIKYLKYEIRNGTMTSKEAHRYLAGHRGYIKYADVNNLMNKLFYIKK